MEKGFTLKFGTSTAKHLALFMGICYLANPLHRPISSVLHEVIAIFESPNEVLGQRSFLNPVNANENNQHAHTTMEIGQGHELIDFVNSLFESSENSNDTDEAYLDNIKIDKHVTLSSLCIKAPVEPIKSDNYKTAENKLMKAHLQKSKAPPQLA